ncbi:efflux RND transporter permease subunit [Azospira oryzae]|uniref:Efflux pump membrane transporter n=2 Tax=Azospira oryzae TaxID=146939 RepID=G8QHA2_AZOOP|nr:multidrug efflux RND transporter permease subunit [Azospira oryzae]AEV26247.1 hydrophobe/amphiphile efflux-1 (HAE1) family transporter [Azospira oryzae PS]RZT89284.1 HAE1 family hydrophobic/amphiphilic exporter-1/multidrug efflux pump [Azospira oryzae]TLS17390.1 MAG: multidrug efflux RND transporter permease subunit [Betaproteobacteria bacterium]
MSRFFINRPIFASVISIVIVIAGIMASRVLPISQYPEIAPPTVIISASYPGASAETLAKTVAAPIEEQLSGVENLMYFNSTASANGSLSITATFEVGTDVDMATVNVNNRVKIAEPRLPDVVRQYGVTVQKRSNDILMVAAITSPEGTRTPLYLSNYALVNILDDLKRIPGVGDAQIFGALDYSMRLWLRPDRMAQLGVTTTEISNAIAAQNKQNAAGKIGQEPAPNGQQLVYTVTAKGRLTTPEQFGNIVIRADGPKGALYLKDVARVELGAQNYDASTALMGKPVVGVGIFLQSGANALDVAKKVKLRMDELKQKFPSDVDYVVPFDTTKFVQASITEVVHTLVEALVLVAIVVFVFLQNWRATVIPLVAVPVSLIGTFAGLWLFGFSINTLTLFAMVLAIGIVVDDAIVVLENVERLMWEEKMAPKEAAIEAMREVSSAVVAIVLVLCAVFIPVAFLGGIAGMLYKQFAVTVAISVTLSGIVALTLTPALCALLLQPKHEEPAIFRPFNRLFERFTKSYTDTVNKTLHHRIIGTVACVVILGGSFFMFRAVPGGFVPAEDQGYLISALMLPDGASLQRTRATGDQFQSMIKQDEAVDRVFVIAGNDIIGGGMKPNAGTVFIPLKDWDERKAGADDLAKKFMGMGMMLPDGLGLVFNPPAIRGLGNAGGFEAYIQARGDADPQKLSGVVQQFMEGLKKRQELVGINTFFRPTSPQLSVEVNEAKAISMGIAVSDVYQTLQATMGTLYVNDFNLNGRTYRVQLQADGQFRSKPEDLGRVYVKSSSGSMVPVSALIKVKSVVGPEQLERFNGFLSAKVMGSSVPKVSTGDAIKIVEEVAKETLPAGYELEWTGQAFQEKRTGTTSAVAFGFGIIMVFLILAAQYEKWSLPLAVILAVPFALFGALAAVMIRGMPNDIYFQIGLVVLIGLAAKNAILIVEFAAQKRAEGLGVLEAALEGARLRFRPIVMTSLAFILGVFPLVKATGAGAAARKSMGTGVFGGMLAATFIATIFIPMFFTWLSGRRANLPEGSYHHVAHDNKEEGQ